MKALKQHNLLLPLLITLLATIVMASCIFLPYSTAIGQHAENLKQYPDTVIYKELNMTAGDMINLSMVEYANVYSNLGRQIFGNDSLGTIYTVLVALIGVFSLLAIIFTIAKKPVAVMIFSMLAFAVFMLQNADFTDRGVIPSSTYNWGLGYYIFYIATLMTFCGSIWLLLSKRKIKNIIDAQ